MKNFVVVLTTLLVILSLLSFSAPAHADSSCPQTSQKEIANLFANWNNSLQTHQPEKVAKNYADDGILLPTVSDRVRHNHAEIEEYFEHFLALNPTGAINEQNIRIFCDIAVNSGIYTFKVVKQEQPSQVRARYTFVYRKIGDRWKIIEHHSSAMPEKTS
ncbi:MAG: SgcJ/EcaC family oxidoreductase [Xenococcaceae cyanobacterium]